MLLGWFRFEKMLKQGYDQLLDDIQKVNQAKKGVYENLPNSQTEQGKDEPLSEEDLKEQEDAIAELLGRQIDL